MQLTITINLDNEAFQNGGTAEVAEVLDGIASRLPEPLAQTRGDYQLHDSNGNWCGSFGISDSKGQGGAQ